MLQSVSFILSICLLLSNKYSEWIVRCTLIMSKTGKEGIGSLIASGIVKDTKENMFQMIHNTGITYLKGLGAKL